MELVENKDYKVSYRNNNKAGIATITFKGMGRYTGSINRNFKINAYDLNGDKIRVSDIGERTYSPSGVTPKLTVTYENDDGSIITLAEGKDYSLRYVNHQAAADKTESKAPTVIITGKGGFGGSKRITFTIKSAGLATTTMTAKDVNYQKRANRFRTSVTLCDTAGKRLTPGKDYGKIIAYTYGKDVTVTQKMGEQTVTIVRLEGTEVDVKDIIPPGTEITATVTGTGKNYYGKKSVTYKVVERSVKTIRTNEGVQVSVEQTVQMVKEDIRAAAKQSVLRNNLTYRVACVK